MKEPVLTPEQAEYVNSQYGKITTGELARQMGVSRNCIAGRWSRYREANRIVAIGPVIRHKQRNEEIFDRYRDQIQGAKQIAHEMGLSIFVVEGALKTMRAIHKMPARGKPKAEPRPKKIRTPRPDRTELRVIGADGKPLPFRARPVPAKEGVMPVPFEELDILSLGDGICRCRHYVGDAFKVPALFCGDPTEPGRAYCSFHMMIAYRAVEAPKLDADKRAEFARTAKHFLIWRADRNAPEQLREAA